MEEGLALSVYVDDMKASFGAMKMSHMWADSEADLLAMADRIGVQRKWIQGHPVLSTGKGRKADWVHFDIAQSKRVLAVAAGAIETDRYGPVEHVARLRLAVAIEAGDEVSEESARRSLAMVEKIRARRA